MDREESLTIGPGTERAMDPAHCFHVTWQFKDFTPTRLKIRYLPSVCLNAECTLVQDRISNVINQVVSQTF